MTTEDELVKKRSADAALKGYAYQFDRTVLELLDLSESAEVAIEAVEDIDVLDGTSATAIQVKYYESTPYSSPKTFHKPLVAMLTHFRTGARWKYTLYVYFSDATSVPGRLTLAEMKEALTRHDAKLQIDVKSYEGLTDQDLQVFAGSVRIEKADVFADQEQRVIDALASALKCSADEVVAVYLAKARDYVQSLARLKQREQRISTRARLLKSLEVKELLFSLWQAEHIGLERYFNGQIRYLRRRGYLDPQRKRAFLVRLTPDNIELMAKLTRPLAEHYVGKLVSAKPWTLVLNGSQQEIIKFKTALLTAGVHFNDGFESVKFSPAHFTTPPILNVTSAGKKIAKSSFTLRVVALETMLASTSSVPKFARMIIFGAQDSLTTSVADDAFVLRNYDIPALQQLIEKVH